MSVFNDAPTTPLVGEGGKYKDYSELEKAYLNANEFIDQLKTETKELREEVVARVSVEEALAKIQAHQPVVEEKVVTPPVSEPAIKPADLQELVRQELNQERQQSTVRANIEAVANRLIETYGNEDKANEFVLSKAKEIGVEVSWLQDTAAKNPTAFYKIVGLTEQATPAVGTPLRSDVNTTAFVKTHGSGPKEGTEAWYRELRKADPKRYYTPAVQNQKFQDAKRLGEAFHG